ncbi:hypothetical protein Agub_g12303, partial [Astrephomene gubernaculifera]
QNAATAAEWLLDAADGTYVIQLDIGGMSFNRTVVVDRKAPTVNGSISVSSYHVRQEPAALTEASLNNVAGKRAFILHYNFSEPVVGFNPVSDIIATNAVIVDWEASADNTSFWVLALSEPYATVLGAPSNAPLTVEFYLPRTNYSDEANNPGSKDLRLTAALKEPEDLLPEAVTSGLDTATRAVAIAYPAAIIAENLATAASSSFAQVLRAKGSLLQGSYHMQLLTMTMYLA